MKAFIDDNGRISKEEFQKQNPRPPSSRHLDASGGFKAVPQSNNADFGITSDVQNGPQSI